MFWTILADGLDDSLDEGGDVYAEFRRAYFAHPDRFIAECVNWEGDDTPSKYQLDIARDLQEHHRVAAKGPRRLGKTAVAALLILWFALTRDIDYDWKIVVTAGAGYQITRYTFPEVHKWVRRLKWDLIGRETLKQDDELLKVALQLKTGQAFAVVPDRPDLIEGAGAQQFLIVYDEAKSIPPQNWDAAEGAMASGGTKDGWETFALAISTPPPAKAGRFYEIFARKEGLTKWHPLSVSLQDAIDARRVNPEWAEDMRKLWGEESPQYQAQVLGEFADSIDEQSVIPLQWILAAVERHMIWQDTGAPLGDLDQVGVDVARGGEDKTTLYRRHGDVVPFIERHAKQDTMKTAGQIVPILRANPKAKAVIDTDGVGGGVTDRCRELGFTRQVLAFHAGAKTTKRDKSKEKTFANKRSAMWWNMREALDPESGREVCLPNDDKLIADLAAPRWEERSDGIIYVESKKELKKAERLGRSTDDGDGCCQAFWHEPRGVLVG